MFLIQKPLKTRAVFEDVCCIFSLLFREVIWELTDRKCYICSILDLIQNDCFNAVVLIRYSIVSDMENKRGPLYGKLPVLTPIHS